MDFVLKLGTKKLILKFDKNNEGRFPPSAGLRVLVPWMLTLGLEDLYRTLTDKLFREI